MGIMNNINLSSYTLSTDDFISGTAVTATSGAFTITAGDAVPSGNCKLPNSTVTPTGTITVGGVRFMSNYGTNNTFFGYNSGRTAAGLTGQKATGLGYETLTAYTSSLYPTGIGYQALKAVTSDSGGTVALGYKALPVTTTGRSNTAVGSNALLALTVTSSAGTTAVGYLAGRAITTGADNPTLLGYRAGYNLTTSDLRTTIISNGVYYGSALTSSREGNILIGSNGTNSSNRLEIGTDGSGNGQQNACFVAAVYPTTVTGRAVLVSSSHQLGGISSSLLLKENIQDMGDASSRVNKLRPVAFNFKSDPNKETRFGLIAEEVIEIMPELVIADQYSDFLPRSVKYEQLPILILNELQKRVKRVEYLEQKLKERVSNA